MKNLELFYEFKSWMDGKGYKSTVSSSYVAYLRTLLTKLYTSGYTVIPNSEVLFNNIMGYPSLVKGLLEYFDDAIKKVYSDTNCPISQKQLNNGRSAFRKFVEFMLWRLDMVASNASVISQKGIKQITVFTKPARVYQNMMGWKIYTRKDILRILKSRLSTQDRLSGNKVWLSLRVVKELLGSEWFDNWCKSIMSKTKVLIDDHGRFVMLDQVDELILKPDSNGKYSVWIVVGGQEYRVYTHKYTCTSKGTIITIESMFVDGMKDISLEHIKPIHQTLSDLGGDDKLPELSKLSDLIKQVSQTINSHDGAKIKSHISIDQNQVSSDNPEVSVSINLDDLEKDMDLIKDDTDYELMDVLQNIIGSNNNGGSSGVLVTPSNCPAASAVTVSTTVTVKNAHGSTIVKAGMKIGQYAKQILADLLQSKKLSPVDIANLEDPVFCKNKLGMNYPVLVDVTKMVPEKGRYYKSDSSIAPYVICNDWYEKNRSKFDTWLETI